MRTVRGLAIAIAALALVPQLGSAQLGRRFENAWFWGAKTGGIVYLTVDVSNQIAPVFGAEWVITRRRGGLYISVDHAIMKQQVQYLNLAMLPDTSIADVQMNGIRR